MRTLGGDYSIDAESEKEKDEEHLDWALLAERALGMKLSMRKQALFTGLLAFVVHTACPAGIQIEDAFCRGGQVFLHWSDDEPADHYHVYHDSDPITSANIGSAELVCSSVSPGSAKDRIETCVASRQGRPDPNVGVRLYDLGSTIDPQDELWVHTAHQMWPYFYAVVRVDKDGIEDRTITLGENSLTDPIVESPGESVPVIEDQGFTSPCLHPYKTYVAFKRDTEAPAEGGPTKFCVTAPPDYNPQSRYALVVVLHGYSGYQLPVEWWGAFALSPGDVNPDLPYDQHTWWYGYCSSYPQVASGTVVDYSERILLRVIDWVKAEYPIDEDRIFLMGGSMGGSGSISFGLRHPELFAGIEARVPQVNPGLPGIGWTQDQLQSIWGTVEANLPTSDGIRVWDRMNMTAFVGAHKEDLPFLKVQNSKNDEVLPWFQIPDFYRNLNASRHGFIAAWGQGGHSDGSSGLPAEFVNFDIYGKITRNSSYVVVSNSSASEDPGSGDPANGDAVGQMNAGFDWTILSDTPDEWSASIRYTPGGSARADISARRLQQFDFDRGRELAWVLKDRGTGALIDSGRVTAEHNRFFVILSLPFGATDRVLSLYKSSLQRAGDLRALPVGASVELDLLHVTAVFADCCYAEPADRTAGIAILGASGLAEGDLIELKGTRADYDGGIAVQTAAVRVLARSP